MESLLDKVQHVEQEIADRLDQVERDHVIRLGDLREAEEKVLEDIRLQAEKRGQRINKEKVSAAEEEINSLKQDQILSVKGVHDSAKAHRETAINQSVQLFSKTYLSK